MRRALLLSVALMMLSTAAFAMLPDTAVFTEDWESESPGTIVANCTQWDGDNTSYVVASGNWADCIGSDTHDWVWSQYFGDLDGVELQLYHFEAKGVGVGCGNRTNLYVLDENGDVWLRWYGDSVRLIPRVGGTVGSASYLTRTAWDSLDILYNSTTGIAKWYFNDSEVWSASVGAGKYMTRVEWENNHAVDDSDGTPDEILVDNVQVGVVPEPSSLLALSAFGVGMIGYIKRRRA